MIEHTLVRRKLDPFYNSPLQLAQLEEIQTCRAHGLTALVLPDRS